MTLQSLMIKLETSDQDKARLLETMRRYNEACNYVADTAFTLRLSNKRKLQKQVYREVSRMEGIYIKQVVSKKDKVIPYLKSKN